MGWSLGLRTRMGMSRFGGRIGRGGVGRWVGGWIRR